MTISFNQIPINLLTPGQYVEFDNSRAVQGLVGQPQKLLILGQKSPVTGSAVVNTPYVVTSEGQSIELFGLNSMAHHMYMAAQANNSTTETTVIGLPDPDGPYDGGLYATAEVLIQSAPTESGLVNLYIGGKRVRIAVTDVDTEDDIALRLVNAVNADTTLPVTAEVNPLSTDTCVLTAVNMGYLANDIDLRLNYSSGETTPAGLFITINAIPPSPPTPTTMVDGAGAPNIADALANIGAVQYNHIVMPYTDDVNMLAMETELDLRWSPLNQNDGHCWQALRGTVGTLATWADTRNNPHISTLAIETGGTPTVSYVVAAAYGAVASYYAAIDPARPLQTLQMVGVLPTAEAIRFTREERNILLSDGLATCVVDAGGRVLIERAVTNYTLNSYGLVDVSYRDSETMLTLSFLRYSLRARIAQKFPRFKLGNDGGRYGAGQAVVTPSIIRAEIIALFLEWEDAALVENFAQFKKELIVERNTVDVNRVDVLLPPDLINQFRIFAAQIQFRL